MNQIPASLVKELRQRTGLGMMDCKAALQTANGDLDGAIRALREKSALKAEKKAGRTAAEGVIAARRTKAGDFAVMLEINSETDFAARDKHFLAFVDDAVTLALEQRTADVARLLELGLEEKRRALVQKTGENIHLRRAVMGDAAADLVGDYVHSNNRIGVMVSLSGGDLELARDIAMHVAALSPQVVAPEDVTEQFKADQRELFAAQAADSDKPAEIVAKMVEGRLRKAIEEVSLLQQSFVKDPKRKVGELLADSDARVLAFARYEVGEGIERTQDDFAGEVAARMRGQA